MSSTEPKCATRVCRRSELVATQSQGSAPQRALLDRVPDSQALRVRATSLLRVCCLGFIVFWERTRSGCCCSEREGVGPNFCRTLEQASGRCSSWVLEPRQRGAAGAHPQPVQPAPACCWKRQFPLLEGAADPSPSAWASRQFGGERGRREEAAPVGAGRWQGQRVVWVSSRLPSGFDEITEESDG